MRSRFFFSPYYLVYNRNVILPLANILRPRRINYYDGHHETSLQEMHYTLVRSNIRKAKKSAMDESLSKNKSGELMYYKNLHKRGKNRPLHNMAGDHIIWKRLASLL